ncbi:MAG: formate dehydrogenase [Desulfitibacter sp. BRH_c19]|nr:MAG: formate dehydrogenase [Desulfitibacter sp. BRH_c19]
MSTVRHSVCPYDCPDTCGLLVEIENGRAVKIQGDPAHPFTRGTLCAKMAHYEQIVQAPGRLTRPLMRTGQKGSGQFVSISWDEAIEYIIQRWLEIIKKHGAEAILPYSFAGTMGLVQRNCGDAFFHKMGATRLLRTICSSAKGYGWKAVMGETLAPKPDEIKKSDCIILWGTNTLATNVHLTHELKEAKRRGARIFLIETYETPTAKIADRVILTRSGSDGALALGMMQYMVEAGLIDKNFIEQYVSGFDQFKDQVLSDYSLERVSLITGIAVNELESLARQYGEARAPFIVVGSGLSRYGNGAMTVRTITCLPALVGAWAKPGGGLLTSIATGSALPVNRITREDFLSKPTRIINMNKLGSVLNEVNHPPVMSLYVYHSNPVVIAPDQSKVVKGLQREDLFTIVHERFMTDTALYADLVLPATTSLEHPDIYRSYGHYCIQRTQALIPPVGQAKSNWEVFQLLAKGLGLTETYFSLSADELIDQLLDPPSSWLTDVDLSDLHEGKPIELPLQADYKMNFKTTSGKIELYNPKEVEKLPRYLEPYGGEEAYWLISSPSIYSLNSSFNELEALVKKKKGSYLLMNPDDAVDKGFIDEQEVIASNERGQVSFRLKVTPKIPRGAVVIEGLSWGKDVGKENLVNVLTSQRLTDQAEASTLYDVKVDVRPA